MSNITTSYKNNYVICCVSSLIILSLYHLYYYILKPFHIFILQCTYVHNHENNKLISFQFNSICKQLLLRIERIIDVRASSWSRGLMGAFLLSIQTDQEIHSSNLGSNLIFFFSILSFNTFCYATTTYWLITQYMKNKEY